MNRVVTIAGLVALAILWIGAPLLTSYTIRSFAETPGLDHAHLAARASRDLDVADAVSDAHGVERALYVFHRESPHCTRARVIAALRAAVAGDGKGDLAALLALVLLDAQQRGEVDTAEREWSLPLLNSADRDRLAAAYPTARIPAVTISEPRSASIGARWARDTLEIREAELRGDSARAAEARERIVRRAERSLGPARRSAYLGAALALAGLAFAVAFARGWIALPTVDRSHRVALAPWDGVGVFIRANFAGELVAGVLGAAWFAGPVGAFVCVRILLARLAKPVTVRELIGTPSSGGAAIAFALVLFAALELSRVGGLAIDHWLPWTPAPVLAASPTGSFWPRLAIGALASVIFAPFLEEILFRGLLFGSLRSALGVGRAALLSGIAFSVVHDRSIGMHLDLVAVGVVLSVAYQRTGTLVPLMLAHALFNYVVGVVGRL